MSSPYNSFRSTTHRHVKRDKVLDTLQLTKTLKVPVVHTLPVDAQSQVANLVFDVETDAFYVHNSVGWEQVSTTVGGVTNFPDVSPSGPTGPVEGDVWRVGGELFFQGPSGTNTITTSPVV